MSRPPLLFIPAVEPGRGGGHLTRCLALVRELRSLGREAWLFLPRDCAIPDGVLSSAHFNPAWRITETETRERAWEWVILDKFRTPPEALREWAALAPVIGIDEGGPCRDQFDFLIDIMPGLPGATQPNIAEVSLLPLPGRGDNPPRSGPCRVLRCPPCGGGPPQRPPKLLVSFGQEDAAGLGPAVASSLAAHNHAALCDITLITGGLNRNRTALPGVRVLEAVPRLGERLAEYDLLITHYGITAFEAVSAGTPVLLVSPGPYHAQLARAVGFCSAGTGMRGAARVSRLLLKKGAPDKGFFTTLETRRAALALRYRLDREPEQSLAELIAGCTPLVHKNCPVCGTPVSAAINGRDASRSFRRCPACGVIVMNRRNPPPVEYGREYFFELYQKQYGKTYIEDFPHLTAMARRRLAILRTLLPAGAGNPPLLLDIGCAYGPFLAAARADGFSPSGIDPAEDAVRYVTQTLGIPAIQGFFPDCPLPDTVPGGDDTPPHFDVVTLWYVIEHFQNCVPVFAALRRILRPGGLLAFATPSYTGISGRSSLRRFLSQSPADHWTIWSPRSCATALARAGFTVRKIVTSGHHPERFPLLGRFAKSATSPLYGILLAISKLFALGDTFEAYAEYRGTNSA